MRPLNWSMPYWTSCKKRLSYFLLQGYQLFFQVGIAVTLILGFPFSISAQSDAESDAPSTFTAAGYLKYLQNASFSRFTNPALTTNHLIHHRLNLRWFPSENWTFALEFRNRLFYGEEVRLNPEFAELVDQYDGLLDLSVIWIDEPSLLLHTIADRAYVTWSKDQWDVRIGRQRINWGINLVWNPNDIFNAFNYLDFDYEERPGSDAIRIQFFPNYLSSWEIAYAPGDQPNESVGAIKYKFNTQGYDIQLIGGYARSDITVGLGWAGNISQAGFKGEASVFFPVGDSPKNTAGSFSLMGDYQIGSVYTSLAMLYNSEGDQVSAIQGGLVSGEPPSARNLFPSVISIFGQANWQATPLLSVGPSFIVGTENLLTIFYPTITYSIKENWDIDLIAQVLFQRLLGEYGHVGSGVFFRLKWSY